MRLACGHANFSNCEGHSMKILPALLCAASASVFATAASAADLSPTPPPAPLYANTVPAFTWTGTYIGLVGGYSWSHSAPTYDSLATQSVATLAPFNASGWTGGITGGANYQLGSGMVIGLELDGSLAGVDDTVVDNLANFVNNNTGNTVTAKTDATGNIRGRLGYAVNRTLFFGTAGLTLAHSKISSSADATITDSATLVGWTVGAGVEQAITDRVSAKLEYQYTAFGNHTWFADNADVAATGNVSASTIRAGLNYHF
jgi:outer membrane immunogenic protein